MVEDKNEAEGEDAAHVDGEGEEELEKVTIVAPANAVVHPWAVVVEHLHGGDGEVRICIKLGACCDGFYI